MSGLARLLVIAVPVAAVVIVLHAAPLDAWDFYADNHVFDVLHVIGFSALTFWSVGRLRRALPTSSYSGWAYTFAAIAVALLALVSEGSQLLTSRGANLGDVGRDMSGIVAGLLFAAAAAHRAVFRGLFLLGAGLSAIVGLRQPVANLAAKAAVLYRLPVVADFEDRLQLRLFTARGVLLDVVPAPRGFAQGRVARIRLGSSRRYPGIRIEEPLRNWNGFAAFSFRVATVESLEGELTVRIEDDDYASDNSDRFVERFPISRVPVTYRIAIADIRQGPAGRLMDLAAIDRIAFDMREDEFVDFYIDDLRLE